MISKPELSIIVPCYNENESIPHILQRFAEVKNSTNVELILVNNGSTDDSQVVIDQQLQKKNYSFARTVLVPQNIGYGNGIYLGLQQAQADVVAYTHADLQCDPADVFRAYEELKKTGKQEQYLIKGHRRNRRIIPQLLTSSFQIIASVLFFQRFWEINAQPKVFHRSLLEQLKHPPLDFNFDFYVLYKAKKRGLQINSIPVDFPERKYGESKWAFSHLSKLKGIHRFLRYMIRLRFLGEERARK